MTNNNITNKLTFKSYSNEYVIGQLDKYFTCEEQNLELSFLRVIENGNGTSSVNLVLGINDTMITAKKYFSNTTIVDEYQNGDDITSDKAQLEIIKDLIGLSAFKICRILASQQ